MSVKEQIYVHLGSLAEIASLLGAITCVYLMQVILRERTPLVWLQKVTLGLLSAALFANGLLFYPSWALVDGHSPTGALVVVAVCLNLLVMAIRGHTIYQTGIPRRDEQTGVRT
jgi:hypothetical protein